MIRPDYREFMHAGVKGRSGRYPWGSGERPFQRLEGMPSGVHARNASEVLKKFRKDDPSAITTVKKRNGGKELKNPRIIGPLKKDSNNTIKKGSKEKKKNSLSKEEIISKTKTKISKLNINNSGKITAIAAEYLNGKKKRNKRNGMLRTV